MLEKRIKKILFLILLFVFLILLILYYTIGIIYSSGNFSITLDKNLYFDDGLIIYDDPTYKVYRNELFAEAPATFDNISYKWLPEDIHKQGGGSHNGDNYIAYTYYLKNTGIESISYTAEIDIDSVTKGADEAVRVMVIKNGEKTVYGKAQKGSVEPEPDAVAFAGNTKAMSQQYDGFEAGAVDKYTVVIWLEGEDPECIDDIKGGQVRMSMHFSIVDA